MTYIASVHTQIFPPSFAIYVYIYKGIKIENKKSSNYCNNKTKKSKLEKGRNEKSGNK